MKPDWNLNYLKFKTVETSSVFICQFIAAEAPTGRDEVLRFFLSGGLGWSIFEVCVDGCLAEPLLDEGQGTAWHIVWFVSHILMHVNDRRMCQRRGCLTTIWWWSHLVPIRDATIPTPKVVCSSDLAKGGILWSCMYFMKLSAAWPQTTLTEVADRYW